MIDLAKKEKRKKKRLVVAVVLEGEEGDPTPLEGLGEWLEQLASFLILSSRTQHLKYSRENF